MEDLFKALGAGPYPGRGIFAGNSADGKTGVLAYFLMGRSENSRNRVLTMQHNEIRTEFADKLLEQDPNLVIYTALRHHDAYTIVTNGDHTDTIYNCIKRNITFEEALRTRTFEPDAPNYTPRISALMSRDFSGVKYKLSIIKADGGNAASVARMFFEYSRPLPGCGHLLHTYAAVPGEGGRLESFAGEPLRVRMEAPVHTDEALAVLANAIWNALNAENRVALLLRAVDLDGAERTHIINRHEGK